MARRQGTEKRLVAGGAGCVSQSHSFTVPFSEWGWGVTCAAGPASRWFAPGIWMGWRNTADAAGRELSSAGSYFHCAPIGGNYLQKRG
jgi:hypothetical protein